MEKDDSMWSLKKIKEKVLDWNMYFAFFFLLLAISFGILICANFYRVPTNVPSARYLLSALVQSQAAIIAIVISLTLIAVQLTASAYSPRVIKIFRESFGWQALFVFYGISIFYGLLVLKMIKPLDELHPCVLSAITYLKIPLPAHISLAYALGGLTFMILIFYLRSIINLLNPVNIINRLAVDITKENLLNSEEEPIQPIMDIVHGSIMKYDIETTRVGLKAVTERVFEVISDYLFSWDDVPEKYRKDILKNLAEINLDKKKEKVTLTLYDGKILNLNIRKENDELKIYTIIAEFDQLILPNFTMHFRRVCRHTLQQNDEDPAIAVIENLNLLGKLTVGIKLEKATNSIVTSLGEVGVAAAKKEFEEATRMAAGYIGEVGVAAAKNDLENAPVRAVTSIGEVGVVASKQKLSLAAGQAIESLGLVGKVAVEKKLDAVVQLVTEALNSIGESAVKTELEDVLDQVVDSLGFIGLKAAEQGRELDGATRKALECLGSLGVLLTDKYIIKASKTAFHLGVIGTTALKNGLEIAAQRSAKYLVDLVILSEEPVKQAFTACRSELDEESFHQFKEIFEEEIKEREGQIEVDDP